MNLRKLIAKLIWSGPLKVAPELQPLIEESWRISAKLAGANSLYTLIYPADLADLIHSAKKLHPEIAAEAERRDGAAREQASKALKGRAL